MNSYVNMGPWLQQIHKSATPELAGIKKKQNKKQKTKTRQYAAWHALGNWMHLTHFGKGQCCFSQRKITEACSQDANCLLHFHLLKYSLFEKKRVAQTPSSVK